MRARVSRTISSLHEYAGRHDIDAAEADDDGRLMMIAGQQDFTPRQMITIA